jgi:myo-inositol-1(or 4)-monophosphatase
MDINNYTKTAIKAALTGGEILKKYFAKNIKVSYKGKINPVTDADKLSQKKIFEVIKKEFPRHDVMGEEEGRHSCKSEHCWIVDPLDGTVNFIHDLPIFSVSVGLGIGGKIVSGVIYAPLTNEIFYAQEGAGAWLNGKRIKVSSQGKLVHSLCVTGFSYDIHINPEKTMRRLAAIMKKVQGLRRLGSAALDLAYVAAGRFDAFWEEGLSPWDIAAGAIIVKEAGGKITDFDGQENVVFGKSLLATNGKIHNGIRKLLNRF